MIPTAAAVLFVLFVPQDPAEKVLKLVDRLTSDEIVERESALVELVKLGSPAVPHLRMHIGQSTGETRVSLIRVVLRIERDNRLAVLTGPGPRVTMKAKDRPAGEVLDEIRKQTEVPMRIDVPPGTLVSLDVKDAPLVEAVDQMCRSHGKIMYAWSPRLLHVRSGAYRRLPMFAKDSFRFIVDALAYGCQRGNSFPWFSLQGGVVGPQGSLPDLAWIDVQEAQDDKGTDLGKSAPPSSMRFSPNSSWIFPQVPEGRRLFLPLSWSANPVPSPEAAQLKVLRGVVRLTCPVEYKVVATLEGPADKPASKITNEGRTLDIQNWHRANQKIRFHYVVKRGLKVGPIKVHSNAYRPQMLLLHDKHGLNLEGRYDPETISERQEGTDSWFEFTGSVVFTIPPGFEIATLDLMETSEEKEVAIPFEMIDVPIR